MALSYLQNPIKLTRLENIWLKPQLSMTIHIKMCIQCEFKDVSHSIRNIFEKLWQV